MATRVIRKLLVQRIAVEEDDIHARKAWTAQPLEQCNPLVPQAARLFGMLPRGWNRPHDARPTTRALFMELYDSFSAASREFLQFFVVVHSPAKVEQPAAKQIAVVLFAIVGEHS